MSQEVKRATKDLAQLKIESCHCNQKTIVGIKKPGDRKSDQSQPETVWQIMAYGEVPYIEGEGARGMGRGDTVAPIGVCVLGRTRTIWNDSNDFFDRHHPEPCVSESGFGLSAVVAVEG